MFNFGNAREAISTSDGPVLITAGPGTGKTYTLVQRTFFIMLAIKKIERFYFEAS